MTLKLLISLATLAVTALTTSPREGRCKAQSHSDVVKLGQKKEQQYFPFAPITGQIQLYEEEGNSMFYWLFPSKRKETVNTDPVLIWMNGGPGCASTGGLFREHGPYYVYDYKEGQLPKAEERTISWNAQSNMIFVDQPLGIGLSTVTTEHLVKSWRDVATQFLLFYELFLEKHPEFKGRELYVSGESYGGHWVPYTSYALFRSDNPDINLKGFIIGNGLIDYKWLSVDYPNFSYKNRQYTNFTKEDKDALQPKADLCRHLMDFKPMPKITFNENQICDGISDTILTKANDFQNKTYGRPFDVYYMPSNWPTNSSWVSFLNSEPVKNYLNVHKEFDECNDTFLNYFRPIDDRQDSREMIVPMLEAGVNVWVFDGDQDWICNYEQEEEALDTMVWHGRMKWLGKELEKCDYGLCKQVDNLKYIRFAGAGHMVPVYKPHLALQMINEFLSWNPKADRNEKKGNQ